MKIEKKKPNFVYKSSKGISVLHAENASIREKLCVLVSSLFAVQYFNASVLETFGWFR